jgi:hypothetical protein
MDNNLERQRAWTIRSCAQTVAGVTLRLYLPRTGLLLE